MSYNKVILMGNLTRDPELKRLQGGASVLNFNVGINKVWYDRNRQKQQEASFPSCVAWNRTAEFIAQYFRKGSPIMIDGELRTRDYVDTASGQKRYVTEVLVQSAAFCGGAKKSDMPSAPQGMSAAYDAPEEVGISPFVDEPLPPEAHDASMKVPF